MGRRKDSEHDRGFAAGFACAVGIAERVWGETSLCENLIKESGISQNAFRRACDPYDYNVIARLFRARRRNGGI